MTNSHYGEIGDIWKHVPLAEVLAHEHPERYWESHAGSASYPLSRSWQREYGLYRVLDRAATNATLATSPYVSFLAALPHSDGYPVIYPGSATLAMRLLGRSVSEYVLCDRDPASIASLDQEAHAAGVADLAQCIQDDGVAALGERMAALTDTEAARTLVHIDPFQPHDTSGRSGLSTGDLCCAFAGRGCMVVYWYAVMLPEERGWAWRALAPRLAGKARSLWAGEMSLTALRSPDLPPNPGVLGCGVVCAHLSEPVRRTCRSLGGALASEYRDAVLPESWSGALEFTDEEMHRPRRWDGGR